MGSVGEAGGNRGGLESAMECVGVWGRSPMSKGGGNDRSMRSAHGCVGGESNGASWWQTHLAVEQPTPLESGVKQCKESENV